MRAAGQVISEKYSLPHTTPPEKGVPGEEPPPPGAHGGSQQIGARIAYNEIDMVLFFSDPQSSDLDPDLKYINQMCDQYNIPFATNAATAEILIHGLERGDLDWREIINPSLKPVTV